MIKCKTKIFLASSNELSDERAKFVGFINIRSNQLKKSGYNLEAIVWENLESFMQTGRTQQDYNKIIRESEILVLLVKSRVGHFTKEEFDTAYHNFQIKGKPFVFVYFLEPENQVYNDNSVQDFKDNLERIGYYYTVVESYQDFENHIRDQLDILISNNKIKKDRCWFWIFCLAGFLNLIILGFCFFYTTSTPIPVDTTKKEYIIEEIKKSTKFIVILNKNYGNALKGEFYSVTIANNHFHTTGKLKDNKTNDSGKGVDDYLKNNQILLGNGHTLNVGDNNKLYRGDGNNDWIGLITFEK